MSIFFSFLIAVLVIGTFSLVWERRWKNRRVVAEEVNNSAATPLKSIPISIRETLEQGVATLRTKLPLRHPGSQLEPLFRAWLKEAAAGDSDMLHWINALSPPAYSAFVDHVADYTDEMGFALADLVQGKMAGVPIAAEYAHQVVVHFCRANYQAALAQEDFDGYRLYATYMAAPSSAAGQQFTHQLYAQLVAQQLVPPPTPDVLGLTDQERTAQMQEAIRQSAEKPDKFRTALNTVAAERQRSAADVTVANIVQQAMSQVAKFKAGTNAAQPPTTNGTAPTRDETSDETRDETSDETVVIPA